MNRTFLILCILVLSVAGAHAQLSTTSVAHYTTHATGDFNGDGHQDMIIVCTSGRAFLLLGTGTGFVWKGLVEQSPDEAVAPDGWPKGCELFVQENGKGFDVFTRSVRGKLSQFSTAALEDAPFFG